MPRLTLSCTVCAACWTPEQRAAARTSCSGRARRAAGACRRPPPCTGYASAGFVGCLRSPRGAPPLRVPVPHLRIHTFLFRRRRSRLQIGCVFNHQQFYANIQKSDAAAACVFDLENEGLWKAVGRPPPATCARQVAQAPVLRRLTRVCCGAMCQMDPRVIIPLRHTSRTLAAQCLRCRPLSSLDSRHLRTAMCRSLASARTCDGPHCRRGDGGACPQVRGRTGTGCAGGT